jgi:hypothetical protein
VAYACCIALLLLASTSFGAPRRHISVFVHGGADDPAVFAQFSGILDEEIQEMIAEVGQELEQEGIPPEQRSGLELLRKVVPKQAVPQTERDFQEFQMATESLEVLVGTFFKADSAHVASSTVFFGALGAPLKLTSVRLKMPVTPRYHEPARKAFAVITLFVLAIDALEAQNSPLAASLLRKALDSAKNFRRSIGINGNPDETFPKLAQFEKAINVQFKALRERGP